MNMGRTRSRSSSSSSVYIPFSLQHLCVLALFVLILHCDARKLPEILSSSRTTKTVKRFDVYLPLDSSNSNSEPYGVSSPFNLPPYDSLAPIPLPENSPPYCLYPPPFPPVLPPPSTTVPSPGGYILSPPMPRSPPQIVPSPTEPVLSPPQFVPSPTEPVLSPPQFVPSPTEPVLSPPQYEPSPTEPILSPPQLVPSPIEPVLSPPRYEPSPPASVPPPTGHLPSPFLPPVVYPPPTVPPPPSTTPPTALWCVAKPAVPEPIIQEAMNYACASGADCNQIQPNGSCFQPDSLFAHASYAFNSYWQRTKEAGGTCEFGSTAMLVTVDPSYDGCHFTYL